MVEFFTNTYLGMLLVIVAQILLVIVPLLVALAFLMYADRKIWAAVMMRKGPNVVGAFGLLQSFADFIKYIVKEVVFPAGADRTVFLLAGELIEAAPTRTLFTTPADPRTEAYVTGRFG